MLEPARLQLCSVYDGRKDGGEVCFLGMTWRPLPRNDTRRVGSQRVYDGASGEAIHSWLLVRQGELRQGGRVLVKDTQ